MSCGLNKFPCVDGLIPIYQWTDPHIVASPSLSLFLYDIYIYLCMYVCMHACMYVCMHVCMHAWMYVCMNVCMHGTMRSIMSENVGKKWKVAEIENLPKLKGGGWNWNNFKKCLGVPPPKISRDREGVYFLQGPKWPLPNKNRGSSFHPWFHHAYSHYIPP